MVGGIRNGDGGVGGLSFARWYRFDGGGEVLLFVRVVDVVVKLERHQLFLDLITLSYKCSP